MQEFYRLHYHLEVVGFESHTEYFTYRFSSSEVKRLPEHEDKKKKIV
jgi:hypothetical protein